MRSLTLNEILADLERFPNTRFLAIHYDALESPYVALRASSRVVTQLAQQPIVNAFRRVLLDPVGGIILLMSLSAGHAVLAEDINKVVDVTAMCLGINSLPMGATRWRRWGDPEGTGIEPDKCYYVGDSALQYLAANKDEKQDFVDMHPPELVVEVTMSHFDEQKIYFYRDRGVPEYWQVRGGEETLPQVSFLGLQERSEPLSLYASLALPGFTPEALQHCLEVSQQVASLELVLAICDVLEVHGVIHPGGDSKIIGGSPTPKMG